MLLQRIARNHAEDTVSDIIWYICKKDIAFTKSLLSNFLSKTYYDEFIVIDVVRNYIIKYGYMPDLTFLLRHKKSDSIYYIIIETKINAPQNIYKRKKRIKKQFSEYKKYLNRKNKGAQKKFNIIDKCVLLCPSYYDISGEEDNVDPFIFPKLLRLLKHSTVPIKDELIRYIEEEFEGTFIDLNENLEILNHKRELIRIQKTIKDLRRAMLSQNSINKSGLWQKTSDLYCYFEIGLKTKNIRSGESDKWKNKSWLSYEFFLEEDVTSPVKLSFPSKIIKNGLVHIARYQDKNKFYCDILTESKVNPNFIKIFDRIKCDEELKRVVIDYAEYYGKPNKQEYLIKYNEFFNSLLNYFDRFRDKMFELYQHSTFDHILNNEEVILRMIIKKRINSKYSIFVIAHPTTSEIFNLLRIELCSKSQILYKENLIEKHNGTYKVKYELEELADKIDQILKNPKKYT